jgi:hypothetical protein
VRRENIASTRVSIAKFIAPDFHAANAAWQSLRSPRRCACDRKCSRADRAVACFQRIDAPLPARASWLARRQCARCLERDALPSSGVAEKKNREAVDTAKNRD